MIKYLLVVMGAQCGLPPQWARRRQKRTQDEVYSRSATPTITILMQASAFHFMMGWPCHKVLSCPVHAYYYQVCCLKYMKCAHGENLLHMQELNAVANGIA